MGEMFGACNTHMEMIGVYKILVGNTEGKRKLRRTLLKLDDNIKMDFREIGLGGLD